MDIALSFTDATDTSTDEQAVVDAAKAFLSSLPPTVTVTSAEFDGPTLGQVDLLPAPPAPTLAAAAEELGAAVAAISTIAVDPDGSYHLTADEVKAIEKAQADVAAAIASQGTPPAPAEPAPVPPAVTEAPAAAPADLPTTATGDSVAL